MSNSRNLLITDVNNLNENRIMNRKNKNSQSCDTNGFLPKIYNTIKLPALNSSINKNIRHSIILNTKHHSRASLIGKSSVWDNLKLSYNTHNEDLSIKTKLVEYDRYLKDLYMRYNPRNNLKSVTNNTDVTYEELNDRFNKIAFKLNSIIATEAPIQLLWAEQQDTINLKPGLKCHYKVSSRDQLIPMKIILSMKKGISSTFLSVSRIIERPTKDNCEKTYIILSKNPCLTFAGSGDKMKLFTTNWIYITVECVREVFGTIRINFGGVKKAAKVSAMTLIDSSEVDEELEPFVPRRKKLSITILPSINRKTKEDFVNDEEHRKLVLATERIRRKERQEYKLALIAKKKLDKWNEELIKKKSKEFKRYKKQLELMICLSKIYKMGLRLNEAFKETKSKEEYKILCCRSAETIKIVTIAWLSKISKTHKSRIQSKLQM